MKVEEYVWNGLKPGNYMQGMALFLAASASLAVSAADWRQFRGPNGSGIAAPDAQPATTWSDAQNVAWKTALPGPGSSSPIITDDSDFNATPAVVGRQLFLRSNRNLYCIESVRTADAGKSQ